MSYTIDTVHSHVGFSVRHMMVTTVRGQFTRYTGTAAIDAADASGSTAKADKATDSEIQRFRDFRDDVKRLQQLATPPQGAPSLQGAQANNIVAQTNAADLMGGGGPPMPPGGAPPMPPGPPMLPPGVS